MRAMRNASKLKRVSRVEDVNLSRVSTVSSRPFVAVEIQRAMACAKRAVFVARAPSIALKRHIASINRHTDYRRHF
jgi:hypothetical protein